MKTKVCVKCKVEKPEASFYFRADRCKHLRRSACKNCQDKATSLQRRMNLGRARYLDRLRHTLPSYRRRKELYRARNANKIRDRSHQYYLENQEKIAENNRIYALKNRDKIRKRFREYSRVQRKINPLFRIRNNLSRRIRKGLKTSKSTKTLVLLGCSVPQLRGYLEFRFKPGMSWNNYGRYGWHIDHIKPCASFDLTDPEQQKQCFHYTNLQPLWWWENLSKGDK